MGISRSEYGFRAISEVLGLASRAYITSVILGEPETVSLADHADLVASGPSAVTKVDSETVAVLSKIERAMRTSALPIDQFAVALGVSLVEFRAYWDDGLPVPAVVMDRLKRVIPGLARAHARGWLTPPLAATALREVVGTDNLEGALSICRQFRRHLREALDADRSALPAWHARPTPTVRQWDVLLAAIVDREFDRAGLKPPPWTQAQHLYLTQPWTLEGPRPTKKILQQTPSWLAARNLYITDRVLGDE